MTETTRIDEVLRELEEKKRNYTAAAINKWYEENNQYDYDTVSRKHFLTDTLFAIEAGNELIHAAIGDGLETLFPGLVTSYGAGYGVVVTAISYNGFKNASEDTLDYLEECLERTFEYLLSVDEVENSYYKLESELIESTLEYYPDFTDEERSIASEFFMEHTFFSDSIDYCESDLMERIGRVEK